MAAELIAIKQRRIDVYTQERINLSQQIAAIDLQIDALQDPIDRRQASIDDRKRREKRICALIRASNQGGSFTEIENCNYVLNGKGKSAAKEMAKREVADLVNDVRHKMAALCGDPPRPPNLQELADIRRERARAERDLGELKARKFALIRAKHRLTEERDYKSQLISEEEDVIRFYHFWRGRIYRLMRGRYR